MQLSKGESATVAGYRVTYLGREITTSPQKSTVKARVRIQHNGNSLGVYAPAISTFPATNGGIGTPSVHTGLFADVYLTLVSSPNAGRVTIGVAVKPMVVWLWTGGAVIALGTAVAIAPSLRRRRRSPAIPGHPDASGAEPERERVPV